MQGARANFRPGRRPNQVEAVAIGGFMPPSSCFNNMKKHDLTMDQWMDIEDSPKRPEGGERRDRLEARRGVFGEFAAVAHSRRTLWYRLPTAPRQKPTCRAGVLHRLR